MCRKNQMLGAFVFGLGMGLVISACMESGFLCGCAGSILLAVGGLLFLRR